MGNYYNYLIIIRKFRCIVNLPTGNAFSITNTHTHTSSDESIPIDWININLISLFLLIISAELKMDVLREREVKDSLERQLTEEQKLRGEIQKKFPL